MDYIIMTDVSCDMDRQVAQLHDIKFISMQYSFGKEMLVCSGLEENDTLKAFYDGQRNGDLTSTSQISPFMYMENVEPYLKEGKSVLYLSLSGGLSSTYQSALSAQKELSEHYPDAKFVPVDSYSATGGMGVLVERAIRNRDAGMTIDENVADLKDACAHIRHWFMVQDLMYLKRGGRVSAATAVVGTVLSVKPILCINKEGKLETIAKARGNKAAAREVLSRFEAEADLNTDDVIYVVHGDAPEVANMLVEEIRALHPNVTVRVTMLSPIIGAHTGPGMAAICHIGK